MCMLAKKLNTTNAAAIPASTSVRGTLIKRQNNKRASNLKQANNQILGTVVRRLRNVEQVRYQATHQVARLVAIIIRETHALVRVKQIFSHLTFHAAP